MSTVESLIVGGYNRSGANDPGKLAQDDELISHANRVYQRAWSMIARARPDEFSSSTALAALGGVPPVTALPANIIDILGILNATGDPVWVIPITERNRLWHVAPCVYRRGMSLVSRNEAGDPIAGAVLTALVLDAPTQLTALADVLDTRWPVRHDQLLVDFIGCYLSTKDTGRSAENHNKLLGELKIDVVAFAEEFGLAPEAVSWIHAPVERQAQMPG